MTQHTSTGQVNSEELHCQALKGFNMVETQVTSRRWTPAENWAVFSAMVFTMAAFALVFNSFDAFNPSSNQAALYNIGVVVALSALGAYSSLRAWRLSRAN